MREHRAEIAAIADDPQPADVREHGRRARRVRPRILARRRRLPQPRRVGDLARAAGGRARARAEARRARQRDPARREALRADRRATCARGRPASRPRSEALLERMHLDFAMAGARLAPEARRRAGEIAERLALLTTTFRQNVLHDEATQGLLLRDERDLAGLPAWLRDAAREAARQHGEARRVVDLALALARRAVPRVVRPPRPSRARVPAVDAPRRARRRARQPAASRARS